MRTVLASIVHGNQSSMVVDSNNVMVVKRLQADNGGVLSVLNNVPLGILIFMTSVDVSVSVHLEVQVRIVVASQLGSQLAGHSDADEASKLTKGTNAGNITVLSDSQVAVVEQTFKANHTTIGH